MCTAREEGGAVMIRWCALMCDYFDYACVCDVPSYFTMLLHICDISWLLWGWMAGWRQFRESACRLHTSMAHHFGAKKGRLRPRGQHHIYNIYIYIYIYLCLLLFHFCFCLNPVVPGRTGLRAKTYINKHTHMCTHLLICCPLMKGNQPRHVDLHSKPHINPHVKKSTSMAHQVAHQVAHQWHINATSSRTSPQIHVHQH